MELWSSYFTEKDRHVHRRVSTHYEIPIISWADAVMPLKPNHTEMWWGDIAHFSMQGHLIAAGLVIHAIAEEFRVLALPELLFETSPFGVESGEPVVVPAHHGHVDFLMTGDGMYHAQRETTFEPIMGSAEEIRKHTSYEFEACVSRPMLGFCLRKSREMVVGGICVQ